MLIVWPRGTLKSSTSCCHLASRHIASSTQRLIALAEKRVLCLRKMRVVNYWVFFWYSSLIMLVCNIILPCGSMFLVSSVHCDHETLLERTKRVFIRIIAVRGNKRKRKLMYNLNLMLSNRKIKTLAFIWSQRWSHCSTDEVIKTDSMPFENWVINFVLRNLIGFSLPYSTERFCNCMFVAIHSYECCLELRSIMNFSWPGRGELSVMQWK